MPSKYYQRNFAKGYFYHVYNRGANKKRVFFDKRDYKTFIDILIYYLIFPNGKPLSILNQSASKVPNLLNLTEKSSIKLCAYCLMPNHFHLLIKQTEFPSLTNGISNLMRRVIITYAMYAKAKYDRSGILFEGKFKNIIVDSDTQLIWLSKYIHLNPMEILGSEPLEKYRYSSYRYFIGQKENVSWLDTSEIMSFFSKNNNKLSYKSFVEEIPLDNDKIKGVLFD